MNLAYLPREAGGQVSAGVKAQELRSKMSWRVQGSATGLTFIFQNKKNKDGISLLLKVDWRGHKRQWTDTTAQELFASV